MHGQLSSSKERLEALGRRPRRRLSQSFLDSSEVANRIVEIAQTQPAEAVLEVGPGLGVLTERLARQAKRIVAVELDNELARQLSGDNVEVLAADILKVDPTTLFQDGYVVVANLPYHITSPALRHLLAGNATRLVVMVQKEVAERIAAQPGELSALAVTIQVQAEAEIVLRVPAAAFYPRPKVDSAVLRLVPRTEPLIAREHLEPFGALLHAGFAQPRKTLRNSLAQGLGTSSAEVTRILDNVGIDPAQRPQELTLDDWVRLYQRQ